MCSHGVPLLPAELRDVTGEVQRAAYIPNEARFGASYLCPMTFPKTPTPPAVNRS